MSVIDKLNFQPMLITEIFESMKTAGKWFNISKAALEGQRKHPYVTRTGATNGIGEILPHQGFDPPNPGNAITIGVSTSTVFYQPISFYSSREIQVLRHPRLSSVNGPILVALIRQQMVKFQWGNGASIDRLQATRIMVPVVVGENDDHELDWEGLELLGAEALAKVSEMVADYSRKLHSRAEEVLNKVEATA